MIGCNRNNSSCGNQEKKKKRCYLLRLRVGIIQIYDLVILCLLFVMQPHGFFNCSPAVDVPPSANDLDLKDNGMTAKPIQNGLLAKL